MPLPALHIAAAAIGAFSMSSSASLALGGTEIPSEYQGRWALIHNDGETLETVCAEEGWASGDLVIGPTAAVNAHGVIPILHTSPISQTDGIRVDIATISDQRVIVSTELWTLSEDSETLEIASAPQMYWEISNFRRCPAPSDDASLSLLPLPR